jgi:hypothetical protein
MKSALKPPDGRAAFDLIDEAFHLLRRDPMRLLAIYYVGAVPFVLSLIYYWADMSHSGLAYETHARGAAALTVLFVWMKTWQAAYARALWAEVSDEGPWRPRLLPLLRTALRQAALQPWGLVLLPLAMLAALPFGPAYAFFQDLSVMDDGGDFGLRHLAARSARLARLWPRQNFILIWTLSPHLVVMAAGLFLVIMPVMKELASDWTGLAIGIYAVVFSLALMVLSPFGLVVAINIGTGIALIPILAKSLLGIPSIYAENPRLMLTSTFFAVVCGLTYLALDPLVKAGYVLRCFYGESVRSGEDLKVGLRRAVAAARTTTALLVLAAALLAGGAAWAQPDEASPDARIETPPAGAVDAQALDQAITRELADRAYAWRMPREKPAASDGLIVSFFKGISAMVERWVDAAIDFIRDLIRKLRIDLPEPNEKRPWLPALSGPLQLVLYVLLAVILSVAAVLAYRAWKRRGATVGEVKAVPVAAMPDLTDEATSAADLADDAWMALARQLLEQGDFRLALRAAFLSIIAGLAQRRFITIARFKSNLDYRRELGRHAHSAPELLTDFAESAELYESVWYGEHPASAELARALIARQEGMRTDAA